MVKSRNGTLCKGLVRHTLHNYHPLLTMHFTSNISIVQKGNLFSSQPHGYWLSVKALNCLKKSISVKSL